MRIAVVGGGIAGLVAGYRLAPSSEVVVLEASPSCGGKLAGGDLDGTIVDLGAESVLARRPEAVDLMRELGLADRIVYPTGARPAVLIENRRRELPPSVQGVPSDPPALADLLTPEGWQRAQAESSLPAPPLTGDVAIGAYVERRFGTEVTDRLLEPLLAGVYAGRSRELSFEAVAHGLFERARSGGSLAEAAASTTSSVRSGPGPVFAGLIGGVHRLVAALTARLPDVRTGATVRGLRRLGDGFELLIGPTNGAETMTVDAVVLACPAAAAGRLLAEVVPTPAVSAYGAIPYASVAVLTVAVRGAGLAGSGLLLPPGERPTIKAVTHSSRKWGWVAEAAAERWGDGVDLARLSVGRFGEAAVLQVDDEALLAGTFAEARTLPGWESAELIAGRVTRWGGGLPQYRVGHRELVERLRADIAVVPGLAVAGAALDGLGIAACVASAERAAREVMGDWPGG